MTPFAQVRHVLAKDLRQLRWPVLAYIALIGLATVHSLTWPPMTKDIFDMLTIFVVMSGMVVVAQFVQADSPRRVDALWASRPLAPWAVMVEKLAAAALIVLALAVVGQFIGLRALDVPADMMPGPLAESARQYALWLLIAIVLAALTEDLRSFVVALIALPIVFLIVVETFFSSFDTGPSSSWTPIVLGAAAAIGGVSLLAFIYRTRSGRRPTWLAAFVITGCAFGSIVASWRGKAAAFESPTALHRAAITVRLTNLDQIASRQALTFVTDVVPPVGPVRLLLGGGPALIVHLRNGSVLSIPVGGTLLEVYSAPPPMGQGVMWIAQPGGPSARLQHSIPLDDAQRAALAGGIATAELTGQMWVVESRVAGVFPLEIGSRVAHNGTRIAIERLSHSSGDVALRLRIASIPRHQLAVNVAMSIGAFTGREFALLNESRHEAIPLSQGQSSSGGSPMVLPGTNVEESELSLEASPYPGAALPSVDNEWLRSARLVLIDRVPRGSYPFRTSVQLR